MKRARGSAGANVLEHAARAITEWTGSSSAFALAVGIVVVWGALGPVFGYSDTWQLVINTGTTIVTFLMVFLIQATQNRDARAVHLKLDELIRAVSEARTGLVALEESSDEVIDGLREEFSQMREDEAEKK